MTELGLTLADGIQDSKGRVLVRRDASYAVRLFRRALANGDESAASSLGYAYDVGSGVRRNTALALVWYLRAVRHGDTGAAANIATVYRDRGDLRAMFRWQMRGAAMGDGDAMVDAGYSYQYGIGVRKNVGSARKLFRRAIASKNISMWGKEEGLYQLALSYLDADKASAVLPLLKRAGQDHDYPEAEALLAQISRKSSIVACRCRRGIDKKLRGHARCLLHPLSGLRKSA
jgi:TPR repeat protein